MECQPIGLVRRRCVVRTLPASTHADRKALGYDKSVILNLAIGGTGPRGIGRGYTGGESKGHVQQRQPLRRHPGRDGSRLREDLAAVSAQSCHAKSRPRPMFAIFRAAENGVMYAAANSVMFRPVASRGGCNRPVRSHELRGAAGEPPTAVRHGCKSWTTECPRSARRSARTRDCRRRIGRRGRHVSVEHRPAD